MKTGARKSFVWKYFQRSSDLKFVTCDICNKKYKFFNNTTNLIEHLNRLHPQKVRDKYHQTKALQKEAVPSAASVEEPPKRSLPTDKSLIVIFVYNRRFSVFVIMTELMSFSEKLRMMNMISTGKSVTTIGRYFGISEATVRALKRKEHHNRSRVYGICGGKTVAHVLAIERMEKALTLWILEQKETPTSFMIRAQAEEIFNSIKMKKTRNAIEFHATKTWYQSFKIRQTMMLEIERKVLLCLRRKINRIVIT